MTVPDLSSRPATGAESLLEQHYGTVAWSVLLAVGGYLAFVLWNGWHDVVAAVGKVGIFGVSVALSLSLVNYGLRFVRWQVYLQAMEHPMPWLPSLKIYLAGFALTTTPGKAGEMLRSVLLRYWHVPYPKSLAAFLSERLSDLLAIVVLTLFGLAAYPSLQPLIAVGAAGVLTALLLLSSQRLLETVRRALAGMPLIPSLVRGALDILLQTRRCHSPALLGGATALSLVAWAAEAWAFHLILQWMGLDVPVDFAVFVYAISMLAGALSFMPGGLGGAEVVMVTILMWKGVDNSEAIAATVLIRLTTLWFAVGIGMSVLLWSRSR